MNLLFFSDLHIHNYRQYHTRLPNGLNSRLDNCLDIIRQAAFAVAQYDVEHVFFLGDLFESRKSLDIDALAKAHKEIRSLADATPGMVWLLVGNHDQATKTGEIHSLESFKDIDGVLVIDEPQFGLALQSDCSKIAAFPHTEDTDLLKQWFSKIHDDVELVLIHQPLREGAIGPNARTISAELSVKDLPLDKCRYVLAGDYHRRQFFGPENRVHYIGSPLQLKSDDIGEEKGFSLLNTETWQINLIPTDFPEFHLYDTPEEANTAISESKVDPDLDFIRIKYTSDDAKAAEHLQDSYPRIQIDEEVDTQVLTRTTTEIAGNDHALCREYVATAR